MATARPSFTKRQREAAKRERQQVKAAKRAARKAAGPAQDGENYDENAVAEETPASELEQ